MARRRFESLEEYMEFVDGATRDGVRVKAYGGLEVEVPDDYTLPRGQTSGMADAATGDQAAETPPLEEAPIVAEAEAAEPPAHGDTKAAWEEYAATQGVDPTGMTKAEIIEAVEKE